MFAIIIPVALQLFALAGGGGSGGGGGGGGGGGFSGGGYSGSGSSDCTGTACAIGGLFTLVIFVGVIVAVAIFIPRAVAKQRQKFAQELATDPRYKLADDTFVQYQHDWSAFNLDNMKTYMTPHYFYHNQLMMGAMKLMQRQNQVNNITVTNVDISNASDAGFTAATTISATDITNDTRENPPRTLFTQFVTTTEFYKFIKNDGSDTATTGHDWLLDGYDTDTQNPASANTGLANFASANGYCYSLDWGWLLLPTHGVLFGAARFGTSDINNHVIGQLSSTGYVQPDDTIFQLYTYAPNPQQSATYLVAQVAVEKDYGDILVRHKKALELSPRGLTKLSMEWGDFNKEYEVFASDQEKATSFELLDPSYMEKLAAVPFAINIEVTDNVLYLYAKDVAIHADNYQTILTLLQEAYREMRV